MSFEITGLKEAQQKLKELSNNIENLNGQSVPFSTIFTDTFVGDNSSFFSFDKLMQASGFEAESQEDFEAIPDKEWNEFILANTSFENWQEMVDTAGAIYAKKQLGI